MSVTDLVQAALVATLRDEAGAGDTVTGVFDAPPVRAAHPFLLIEEPVFADWGAKGISGREGRVRILAEDAGERPVRLRAICDAVGEALATMPRELGEGWRIVTAVPLRSRIVKTGDARWTGMVEVRLRMLRVN